MPVASTSNPQFYPPKLNPVFTRLVQSISPLVAYYAYQVELVVAAEDIAKIKTIEDHRIVYLPNHPTLDDGIVLFMLSARLGQLFHYIVAKEAFKGLMGKFLQSIGAYSIKRGLGDRASISQTLELLQQPKSRVVIFPEGGCSYKNDTVMPFRSGAIQLPFSAMNQLVKKEGYLPDLYLVPVGLKYSYTRQMNWVIEKSLSQLEEALYIQVNTREFYPRLRSIAEKILINLEREYGVKATKGDWNQRIEQLKDLVLYKCEQQLQLTPKEHIPARERVYKIQSIIDSTDKELTKEEEQTYQTLYRSAFRLLNFDAIYDGYVAENPTPERFLDTLTTLEREVFKIEHPSIKGRRKAFISLGEPINLKDYFSAYQEDKTATVDSLAVRIQQTVQKNVDKLA
ncbi:MAG: 1-acyl-sn-glycerol-3-phosphate acyltransferase [Xenococcaceae cyanobacterium MO_188.B29]|nr:1-acyl-sn-glycerol-3-phosphate acyltransferase [Xenococcaceae cyanobacterium MO_188.B29]